MEIKCSLLYMPANFAFLNWKMLEPNSDGIIYWHIVNFTPDMPKEKTILSFNAAFDVWQQAFDAIAPVGRVITLKSTQDYEKSHLKLYFMNPRVNKQTFVTSSGKSVTIRNNWPFDGEMGVLAHRMPHDHAIFFDEGENWGEFHKYEVVGNKWKLTARLMAVALHELGHSFDLDHTTEKGSLMSPAYQGDLDHLKKDDIKGLEVRWSPIKAKLKSKLASKIPALQLTENDQFSDLFRVIMKYHGLKEIPGNQSDPIILKIIQTMFPNHKDDSTLAWCAVFANAVCREAGYETTKTGLAKDFLKIGIPVELENIEPGDVVIYNRGSNPIFGHVNFYVNKTENRIWGWGGNQSDEVNIQSRAISSIAGIRRLKKI